MLVRTGGLYLPVQGFSLYHGRRRGLAPLTRRRQMSKNTISTNDRRIAKDLDDLDRTDGYKHEHYSRTDVLAACGTQEGDGHE